MFFLRCPIAIVVRDVRKVHYILRGQGGREVGWLPSSICALKLTFSLLFVKIERGANLSLPSSRNTQARCHLTLVTVRELIVDKPVQYCLAKGMLSLNNCSIIYVLLVPYLPSCYREDALI